MNFALNRSLSLAFAFSLLATATCGQAAFVLGSTVSSPQGSFVVPVDLAQITNQSGLSTPYTPGVTDFDTFVAATTHNGFNSSNSGFTATKGSSQQFIFNLGALYSVDALAFWAVKNPGSVTSFEIYSDNDAVFGSGTLLGTYTALLDSGTGTASAAQVFSFASATTQFLHINALATGCGPIDVGCYAGIGEVAFREGASTTAVPEPGSLALASLALLGLAGLRRSQKG